MPQKDILPPSHNMKTFLEWLKETFAVDEDFQNWMNHNNLSYPWNDMPYQDYQQEYANLFKRYQSDLESGKWPAKTKDRPQYSRYSALGNF